MKTFRTGVIFFLFFPCIFGIFQASGSESKNHAVFITDDKIFSLLFFLSVDHSWLFGLIERTYPRKSQGKKSIY